MSIRVNVDSGECSLLLCIHSMLFLNRCSDVTETCHRFLDLTGPFQLGGLPSIPTEFQVNNSHFTGCIRDLYFDSQFVDLNSFAWRNGTSEGCAKKDFLCQPDSCKNAGLGLESDNGLEAFIWLIFVFVVVSHLVGGF